MVVPSCAVTTTVMVLRPTVRLMPPEALPDATATSFTFTVAVVSLTVGVTVRLSTLLATMEV